MTIISRFSLPSLPRTAVSQDVRFGWRAKNPPQYRLEIKPADWADRHNLTPTDDWINRAADMLVNDADDAPRFLLIPNITDYTRDPEKIHEFQTMLMVRVANRVREVHPEFFSLSELDARFVDEHGWVLQCQKLNGAKAYDFSKPNDNHGGGGVYTKLHADTQNWPLFCLSYGPYHNVKGGRPVMADLRQLARDTHHNLEQITIQGVRAFSEDQECIRRQYMLSPRPQDFDPVGGIPIVMFNNLNSTLYNGLHPDMLMTVAGVFHGATQVSRQHAADPRIERPLFKVGLTNRSLAYWAKEETTTVVKNPGAGK